MNTTDKALMSVMVKAQQLGLVAPFIMEESDEWYCEIDPATKPLPTMSVSSLWNNARGRKEIELNYSAIPDIDACPEGVIAHEIGHAFLWHWSSKYHSEWPKARKPDKKIDPLKDYDLLFAQDYNLDDPFNDVLEFIDDDDTDFTYDNWLSWHSWADEEEDFADCFAELVCREGDASYYRERSGVYLKLRSILNAGKIVLKANAVLRKCNREGRRYLFGGHDWIRCPETGLAHGVPLIEGEYVCPCGSFVTFNGEEIVHTRSDRPVFVSYSFND